jgi:hypothetical protein
MAITSSSSRVAAGSGRSYQLRVNDFSQVSGNVGANGVNRAGANGVSVSSNVTQGAPPAQGTSNRKGIRCWNFGSAAGGAGIAWYFNTWLEPMINATSFPPGLDPFGVIEIRALLALDRTAQDINNVHDMGIGISPGNNNQNLFNPAVGAVYRAGVQFGPAGNGKVRFRSRAGQSGVGPPAYSADFDTTNTAVAGFDEREWHWYALRMISGSAGTPGVCKALLDGVLFSQVNMDTTTAKFPPSNAGIGGAFGYRVGVTNATEGLVDFLYIASMHLLMAPTEADI